VSPLSYGYVTVENGFTVEGWFWRNAVPATDWATLVSQHTQSNLNWVAPDPGRQFWFGCAPTSGALYLQNGHEGGGNNIIWTDPSPTGYQNDSQWHHWAVTLDKATRRTFSIFLDGELYHQETTPTTAVVWYAGMLTFGGTFQVIRHGYPSYVLTPGNVTGARGSFAWDQRLAYCAVTNRELTANRVFEHYTAGNGGTVYYGDDEVERLTRILDWSNVPRDNRYLEPAKTTLQGIKVASSNALQQAQKTTQDAGGYLFADGQASVHSHNRAHRYNRWSIAKLGEGSGSAPEIGMTFTTNQEYIYNDIRGDRPFGTRVRLDNDSSVRAYGRKIYEFDISVTDPDELYNAVTWILYRYGKDRVRVSGLEFACESSLALKDLAYSRIDIGDVITLTDLTSPAPKATIEFVVESVDINADFLNKKWTVTVGLSPHDVNQVFEIGKHKLGSELYVGY
jgi:concanavalin A-like lectin/glucanase superfamily protein